jgi:hypothetical protein
MMIRKTDVDSVKDADFLFESWKFLATKAPPSEMELSRRIAYEQFAREFVTRHPNDSRFVLVRTWTEGYLKAP